MNGGIFLTVSPKHHLIQSCLEPQSIYQFSETLWCKGALHSFLMQMARSPVYVTATKGLQLRLHDTNYWDQSRPNSLCSNITIKLDCLVTTQVHFYNAAFHCTYVRKSLCLCPVALYYWQYCRAAEHFNPNYYDIFLQPAHFLLLRPNQYVLHQKLQTFELQKYL